MRGLRDALHNRLDPDTEHGSILVMVAVVVVVACGAAMLAVDAGEAWVSRRSIVTATDAVALAAATNYAMARSGGCGSSSLTDLLLQNTDGATLTRCARTTTSSSVGYVEVEATTESNVQFGRVFGVGNQTVSSSSTAMWGPVRAVQSARPIALCKDDPHVRSLLGAGTDGGQHPSAGVHRILIDTARPEDCSSSQVNVAWLNFDGGSSSTAETRDWLLNGYQGTVAIGDCNADGTTGDGCPTGTGPSGDSLNSALDTLISNRTPLILPVFSQATGTPRSYEIVAFVGAILRGYLLIPDQAQGRSPYLDLEFRNVVAQGGCCHTGVPDTGVRGVRICSIDHDSVSAADRCTSA